MKIDAHTGWVEGVNRVVSPNADARPQGSMLDLIVIHGISLPAGNFGGPWIDRLFTNCLRADEHESFVEICELRVSAHALIRRDGALTQYVPFHMRAWHAGDSMHCGREACNDFSVGIELEGADDTPYADTQYEKLHELILALRLAYPSLADAEIVGHSDIAPDRKTDPGDCFDWDRLNRSLVGGGS